jgi:hypothetical protein
MIVRRANLRLSTIGALASLVAWAAAAADSQPAQSPCQKLTGAERTECERLAREKERQRPESSRPEPAQN